ncbi:MAG: hypothetical protein JNM17_40560 [Archangium sp.]|nr:hypothetical protein [Archangium sp.]
MAPKFTRTDSYEQALTRRVEALPDERFWYWYEVLDRVQAQYWAIEARTSDFNEPDDETGTITFIKNDGQPGLSQKLSRNDPGFWAPHPSTLFYPGEPGHERGFLFVTKKFFTDRNEDIAQYQLAEPPDKWPPRLEDVFAFAALGKALVQADPARVADLLPNLDDRYRKALKEILE